MVYEYNNNVFGAMKLKEVRHGALWLVFNIFCGIK